MRAVLTCLSEALEAYEWKRDRRGEAAVFALGLALGGFPAFQKRFVRGRGCVRTRGGPGAAFPGEAEPRFARRLLGCLLLSDVTSISLM